MLERLLKDTLIYSINTIISRGISILLLPLYTRLFSPADYGSMDMISIFMNLVNLTIALEVSQGIARYLADAKDLFERKMYSSTALWFTVAMYSLFLVPSMVFTSQLSNAVLGNAGQKHILAVAILFNLAYGILYLLQNQFRWELKPFLYSMINFITMIVSLTCTIILIAIYKIGIIGVFIGAGVGNIIGIIVSFYFIRGSFGMRFSWAKLNKMLAFSIPLVPSSIGVFVALYIDRFAIKQLMSMADVGIYGIGYRMASIVTLLITGLQVAFMPLFYANYQAKDTPAKIAAVFRVFVLFALCIFIVLSVFAKEILRIFTTPGYYGASLIIPFLIPAVLLSGMYIFAPGLGLAKKTKHIALINISIAIANTSLNFILIPFIGISGAAMATLFSNLGGFALYIILGNKYYRIDFEWRIIWLAIVITIVIVALGGNISFLSNSLHYLLKAILVILNICIIGNLLIKRKELNQVAFLVRSKINIPAKGIT